MPGDHAVLSPSRSKQFLACTPSIRASEHMPDTRSDAADEGTVAHALGELLIAHYAGRTTKRAFNKVMKEFKTGEYYCDKEKTILAKTYYCGAMQEHCENYATYVINLYNTVKAKYPTAELFIETKIDISYYAPDCSGTGDICIVGGPVLHFVDFKYGKGVAVSAQKNTQMMMYALGLLRMYDLIYDIEQVSMMIYQPRIENDYEPFVMSYQDLLDWGENYLRPRAELAFKGEGEFCPGDHCRFCKIKPQCKALADQNLEMLKHDFKDPSLLTPEESAQIFLLKKEIEGWLTAVTDYMMHEAITNEKDWPGLKLVEGRSNRAYSDVEKVESSLVAKGIEPDKILQPKKLIGITDMEKLLGKKVFNEYLANLIVKPEGKPTLVEVSDSRPIINLNKAAEADFEGDFEDELL